MDITFRNKIVFSLGITLVLVNSSLQADLSSLAKNDPYPMFTALDPLVDRLLLSPYVTQFREEYAYRCRKNRFMISISPFGQNASCGTNIKGEKIYRRVPVELGDLTGRWGLIPLMFGNLPIGVPGLPPLLQQAATALKECAATESVTECNPNVFPNDIPPIDSPYTVDPNQRCGYLSVPLDYRKRGVRGSFSLNFGCGFGINFEGGIARIKQTARDLPGPFCRTPVCGTCPTEGGGTTATDPMAMPFPDYQPLDLTEYRVDPECNELPEFRVDLKPSDTTMDACAHIIGIPMRMIQQFLTRPFPEIAQQMALNLGNFSKTSVEELRLNAYWTNFYEFSKDSYEWPHIGIIPLAMLSISASPGKIKNEHDAFALYFGNNGHVALGATAGLYIDFADTIQIGGEASYTYFNERTYDDLRIPNSKYQTGVYPFFTNATIKPGSNTYFGLRMLAYHFISTLSFCLQYNVVNHQRDSIKLVCCDPAFLPKKLESVSLWSNRSINMSFTYDLLPNFGLGLLWQAPISQKNSYKSSTVLFSVYGFF